MTQDSLYFLRSALPDDPMSKGFRWSLRIVKVNDAVGGVYVAFLTRELAQHFSNGTPNVSVVGAAELDGTHYADFSKTRVVLFKTLAEVQQCLANRADYPYDKHLSVYSPADGLS